MKKAEKTPEIKSKEDNLIKELNNFLEKENSDKEEYIPGTKNKEWFRVNAILPEARKAIAENADIAAYIAKHGKYEG